ncbi:hypothetical protein JFK97_15310 [Chromobacterium phragmitis]|uniref:gp53-like domain-containing protein n=1 Tax=Chromobacterium amazonense TaxID=1382803 RepID=UPI0021B76EF2|nr:hypothetical protein [Chromobacterium amazonense]MBM2885764.1 hypothetical protein [Chromobacterium amazonense]MDE1713885.1 hypothetical protein [Chromobacterium amazonense]
MQDQLKPITSPDGLFHDGNPATGALGTIVTSDWLNGVQSAVQSTQQELLTLLKTSGQSPDPSRKDQLQQAVQNIAWGGNQKPSTLAGYGITDGASKTDLQTAMDASHTLRYGNFLRTTNSKNATGRVIGIGENRLYLGDIDGVAEQLSLQVAGIAVAGATKDGMALNGTPTTTTPAVNANTKQVANVEYVQAAINNLVSGAPDTLNTLKELATALGNDSNYAATITKQLAAKADKSSTLSGYGITDGASKTDLQTAIDASRTLKYGDFLRTSNAKNTTGRVFGMGENKLYLGDIDGIADLLSLQVSGVAVANATKGGLALAGVPTTPTPLPGANAKQVANVEHVTSSILGVFAGVLDNPGYQKFPNGLTLQWGTAYIQAGIASTQVSFKTPFSTGPLIPPIAINNSSAYNTVVSSYSNTGMVLSNSSSSSNAGTISWFAIGI